MSDERPFLICRLPLSADLRIHKKLLTLDVCLLHQRTKIIELYQFTPHAPTRKLYKYMHKNDFMLEKNYIHWNLNSASLRIPKNGPKHCESNEKYAQRTPWNPRLTAEGGEFFSLASLMNILVSKHFSIHHNYHQLITRYILILFQAEVLSFIIKSSFKSDIDSFMTSSSAITSSLTLLCQ